MEVDVDALRRAVSGAAPFVISAALLWLLLEQVSYLRKKGSLPGPAMVVPFLGSAISMIVDPTGFWDRQAARAVDSGLGVSADYIVGRFIVFIRSTELSHKVFTNVRPDAFHLIGHPFGKNLFGDHNMIYMFGDEHKDLRRRIASNFTPKALSTYLHLQQRVIVAHLQRWVALSGDGDANFSVPISLRLLARDMNLETSQTVFAGPYLSDAARRRFSSDYNLFNVGLMAMPFDIPGFAFRRARLAVGRLVKTLGGCAAESLARMRAGGEPTCLVDFWMQDALREGAVDAKEIGGHLFDFLFAAQDASTSSLLWAVALLETHREVLARVREEVGETWTPESGKLITAHDLRKLKYTEAVAREVVRFRPPATLVPHIAGEPFQLTESYTVPKGTIVFPSTYESSFQGFTDPERFDPERFSDERAEDRVYKKNFLAFGAGPHQCVGQRYAINHLMLFIVLLTSLVDFKRDRSPGCDEITYVPTIVPRDDCRVFLSRRCAQFPSF